MLFKSVFVSLCSYIWHYIHNYIFILFHVAKVRLKLYLNAAKIVNISFIYKKVNKSDCLRPSGYNGPLVSKVVICRIDYIYTLLMP